MTRRPGRAIGVAAVAVACALVAGGCGGEGGAPTPVRAGVAVERTQTLVVVGADAAVGDGLQQPLQDSWPHVLHREAFPRTTVLVNAAVVGASAADALRDQVPLVEELSPSVVAIWLGATDEFVRRPVDAFANDLTDVVRRVQGTGARVLLADLPSSSGVAVAGYNRAIARVATAERAALVPLHSLTTGDLTTPRGHRVIAHAFEAALR